MGWGARAAIFENTSQLTSPGPSFLVCKAGKFSNSLTVAKLHGIMHQKAYHMPAASVGVQLRSSPHLYFCSQITTRIQKMICANWTRNSNLGSSRDIAQEKGQREKCFVSVHHDLLLICCSEINSKVSLSLKHLKTGMVTEHINIRGRVQKNLENYKIMIPKTLYKHILLKHVTGQLMRVFQSLKFSYYLNLDWYLHCFALFCFSVFTPQTTGQLSVPWNITLWTDPVGPNDNLFFCFLLFLQIKHLLIINHTKVILQ